MLDKVEPHFGNPLEWRKGRSPIQALGPGGQAARNRRNRILISSGTENRSFYWVEPRNDFETSSAAELQSSCRKEDPPENPFGK